jgi:hypothetical protein
MVSIMVNKDTCNPSLEDIMDKYYEMFRGKNHTNKTELFNRTEDSDELRPSQVSLSFFSRNLSPTPG